MLFLAFLTQKLAPSRALNAIIFGIDEQCNLIFETALLTNCKIYIIFLFRWNPLSFLLSLSQHLYLQTHGWFVTDPKSAINHHRGGPRRANHGGPRWAMAPWPLMWSEPTHNHTCDLKPPTTIHGDLNPPMATHDDLNPTHGEPRQPPTHGNLKPTSQSWERGEASTVRGREEIAWWVC